MFAPQPLPRAKAPDSIGGTAVSGATPALGVRVEQPRRFVYLIRSISNPSRHYVGLTWDVSSRLLSHNQGQSPHTARHRPWRLVVYLGFASTDTAAAFAKHLKSAAGRSLVERYFV